jgi:hypothetical protein
MLDPVAHAEYMESNPQGPFNLTFDELTTVLRRCPKASAEGMDAWDFGMIQQVIQFEPLRNECFEALKVLTELAYSNRLPGRFIMCETRVVFLPKDGEGTRLRPLGIASAWYRLIAKLLLQRYNGPVGQKLGGIQLAVGRPDGCSIGAKVLQHLYDEKFYIQASDSPNAFNREEQNRIYMGLQQYCPQLLNFFMWSYGGDADLRTGSGVYLGRLQTGVRQGDPLSMLFFCVSVHYRLLKLQEMLERFDLADGVAGADRSIIIAYADDFFPAIKLAGHREGEIIRRHFIECNSYLRDEGVPLNMAKTRIIHHPDLPSISRSPGENGYSPLEAQCQTSGIMLGAMISSDPRDIQRTVEEVRVEVERLCKMVTNPIYHLQARYLVLAYCINAYPTYMARIYNPVTVHDGMAAIDTCIDNALGVMLQGNPALPQYAKTLRSLPHRLGGLGITRYTSPSPFSYMHSDVLSQRATAYVAEFLPHLLGSFQASIPLAPPDVLGEGEALVSNVRKRYQAYLKKEYDELLRQLTAVPSTKPVAVSIVSQSFRGSGAAISISGGGVAWYKSALLQRVLQNRLALSCQPNTIRWTCACRYGDHLNTLDFDPTNYTHYTCCPNVQCFRTRAHNEVVKHIQTYLQTLVPNVTIVERPAFFPEDVARRFEGDLMVTIPRDEGAVSWTIDVGIARVTAMKYIGEIDPALPNRQSVLNDPHRAATDYENQKIRKYRDTGAPNLVPFIITCPGNIGRKAALFLDAVEGKHPLAPDEPPDPDRLVILHSARHQLLRSIVHECQRSAGYSREYLELVQRNIPPHLEDNNAVLNEIGFG